MTAPKGKAPQKTTTPRRLSELGIPGPHNHDPLVQGRRRQAAVEGLQLAAGGERKSLLVIQDQTAERWAVYPDGRPSAAFWVSELDIFAFASRILIAVMGRVTPGEMP